MPEAMQFKTMKFWELSYNTWSKDGVSVGMP